MNGLQLTRDRFLGGRVVADQPGRGFRAGHDTVLLAAAVPAVSGDTVLELGAGVGIASLCLAARVEGTAVLGVEIDAALAVIANENAALNAMGSRVHFVSGDIVNFTPGECFDHVFFNPPFHSDTGRGSPEPSRDRAKRGGAGNVALWTRAALALAKDTGTVTAIVRADRTDEILAEAKAHATALLPVLPRMGEAPKRVLVRIAKDEPQSFRTLGGLVLHEADGRNTEAAEAILRHAGAIPFA